MLHAAINAGAVVAYVCFICSIGLHQGCIPFGSLLCYVCVLEWYVSQLYESRIFRASLGRVRSNQWQSMLNLISVKLYDLYDIYIYQHGPNCIELAQSNPFFALALLTLFPRHPVRFTTHKLNLRYNHA